MPTTRTPAPPTNATKAEKTAKTVKAVKAVKAVKPSPAKSTPAQGPEKSVKTGKATQAAAAAADHKPHAKPRAKLVRDSFTMPQQDFDLIDLLKGRSLSLQRPAKKSELLRAGLQALAALPAVKLKQRLDKLEQLKTGRPKKSG